MQLAHLSDLLLRIPGNLSVGNEDVHLRQRGKSFESTEGAIKAHCTTKACSGVV